MEASHAFSKERLLIFSADAGSKLQPKYTLQASLRAGGRERVRGAERKSMTMMRTGDKGRMCKPRIVAKGRSIRLRLVNCIEICDLLSLTITVWLFESTESLTQGCRALGQ